MRNYSKYYVKPEDEFASLDYPQIERDLDQINKETENIPQKMKAEILISFTKNHSLKNELANANPDFAHLVTTGALPLVNVACLFEASSTNSLFQKQFELFLQQKVNNISLTSLHKQVDD